MQSRFPIGQGDVVLQKTTITFDVSVWELFWWSWQGAGIALLEPKAEKNPALIVKAIEARRVTVLHFVPSMTPAGKAFALAVDRPDFWPAAEHRLEGTPLLVGMGLLDCLGWIGGAAPLSLHDLRWRKPVACGPGCRAVLLAREQGDALAVELHHFEPADHKAGETFTKGQATGT